MGKKHAPSSRVANGCSPVELMKALVGDDVAVFVAKDGTRIHLYPDRINISGDTPGIWEVEGAITCTVDGHVTYPAFYGTYVVSKNRLVFNAAEAAS